MPYKYGVNTDEFDDEAYEAAAEIVRQQKAQPVTRQDIDFVLFVMIKEAPHDKQSIKQLFPRLLNYSSITLSVQRIQGQVNHTLWN